MIYATRQDVYVTIIRPPVPRASRKKEETVFKIYDITLVDITRGSEKASENLHELTIPLRNTS